MHHFKKKNSKIFLPEEPRENVRGPRENVSPGPAVALDGPNEAVAKIHGRAYTIVSLLQPVCCRRTAIHRATVG